MAANIWWDIGLLHSGPDNYDDSYKPRSRRTSIAADSLTYPNDYTSSDEDFTFGSLTGEDTLDSLDYRTIQFVDRYLNSEGRKSRSSKRTKDKETYLRQNKQVSQKARASGSRRQSRDHTQQQLANMDGDAQLSDNGDTGSDSQKKADINKRKRSANLQRSGERDAKFDINDITLESPEIGTSSNASLQSSVKIDTTNHFRSLNSKPMVPKECQGSSGTLTPIKQPFQECSRERQDFYMTFSLLIRMGNSEPKIKEDYNFARQVRAPQEPELLVRSREDQIWQNKLNDLVWLELRAWHNGRTIQIEDQALCQERERIGTVLEEVMHFKFAPLTVTECCYDAPSLSNEISKTVFFVDDTDSNESDGSKTEPTAFNKNSGLKLDFSKIKNPESTSAPSTLFVADPLSNDFDPGYACCGFCSIFCKTCLANQNEALKQVKALLDKLDSVESLYPSSRAMKKEWQLYTTTEFDNRFRTLCLYYNLVTDLRQKILTLGKMLTSLGGKNLPWPTFLSSDGGPEDCAPAETPEESILTTPRISETGSLLNTSDASVSPLSCTNRERKSSKCVRFSGDINQDSPNSCNGNVTPTTTPNFTLQSVIQQSDTSLESGSCTPSSPSQTSKSSPILCKSLNRSVSELSEVSFMSPYRRYVDKLLKQKGLRKLLSRLMELVQNTLIRSKFALERLPNTLMVTSPDLPKFGDEPLKSTDEAAPIVISEEWSEELASYGSWSDHYQSMGLPSFRALYLFLLKIPLEIMHECLMLRLEQQPEIPSMLSIRQLMRECKEAIKAAVIIRQKYVRLNRAVLLKPELEALEQDLSDYDDHVKQMLQCYLRYLQSWVQMLLKSTQQTQKNLLEEEWMFVKVFSRYVQRGEALASEMFCSMASSMLDSTGVFLETGLDSCTSEHDRMLLDQDIASSIRHNILQSCRDFKDVFQETRKRALKAIAFAKMLRKDLEIAAEFSIATTDDDLLLKLKYTGHIRLIAPHSSSFVVFIPEHIKSNRPYLWELLSMTYGHEHSAAPDNVESEGYLVIWSCNECDTVPNRWTGSSIIIEPTAEITITLSHLKVEGLLLVVNHSSQLGLQRKVFQRAMGSTVSMTKEFTSCNQSIADSLMDLKKEAVGIREKIKDAICLVEERLDVGCISDLEDLEKLNLQARCREILHQCYKFGFEYHKELTRLVTGEYRCRLGSCLISFAKQWMSFVAERCERGRGVRPRWATKGLDFLMTACEPQYLKQLTEEEFISLKLAMNQCIQHLIGSATDSRNNASGIPGSRSHSPSPHSRAGSFRHSASYGGESSPRYPRSVSITSSRSEPATATVNSLHPSSAEELNLGEETFSRENQKSREDNLDGSYTLSEPESPMDRIHMAIQGLESNREEKLRQANMIGCVRGVTTETTVQISARRVTFHWQRGIKLGQGRFGKVYTAVNNDTGDLMALKEIHLQPNDHKTIKEVADELKIFEGIRNPYLVRYFGVEIHRDEMFIFMEYCDCGTLESAAQLGLPEPQIRKYTRQLLEATSVLHENSIVHRDIKGANIFLTSDGNLKLGDFGCCIKLKNHSTMPGEVNSFVGTQAYMAPEVFTKSVSDTVTYGRAADVWSIGCVVIEMATGNRPWPELENNYQIMFKVGIGETPGIPDNLSDEGSDFLTHCFQFEPQKRWTSIMLLDHPFTKVDSEDEFQSITFFPDIRQFN